MDFALRPPEVNSGLMYTGPGAGSLLAAAAAWDAVATQLEITAAGYVAEITALTGQWFGPSARAMAGAAAPYAAWLHATAGQAAQTSAQAYAAAAAYEAAFGMTVPPPVIAANRARLLALIATNFFGQNTPAIAACEAEYMAMWIQDATAMCIYAADSEIASTLKHFDGSPQTTDESGRDAQANRRVGGATNPPLLTSLLPGNYGPGTYYTPNGYPITIESGGSLILQSGGGVYVDGSITIGPGSSIYVDSGGAVYVYGLLSLGPDSDLGVYSGSTFEVSNGSAVTLTSSAIYVGAGGTVEITSPTTMTNSALFTGPGVVTIGPGNVAFTDGAVTGNFSGSFYEIFNIAPGASGLGPGAGAAAPTSSSVLPPVSALTSSPGLAGTAAIQPQVDAGQLLSGIPSAAD